MKKVLVVLLVGVMVLGFGSVLMAATATSNVIVSVVAIDALTVTNGGTINLNNVVGNNITGTPDATAQLSYTTNTSSGKREITAQATTVPGGTDITLTTAVTNAHATGTQTIVTAGTANTAQPVLSSIPNGAITGAVVTYGASCTATGTPAGSYTFTVTFTSLDAS
ncbi:MAG: hypothetical protein ACLQDF_09820 [Desulfomonilia bacterium]